MKIASDEFDIELRQIKVKVNVGVQKFLPFTTIQTVRSYSSTLVQARSLILKLSATIVSSPGRDSRDIRSSRLAEATQKPLGTNAL